MGIAVRNSGFGQQLQFAGRGGRDTGALRQSAQKIDPSVSWKDEVHQRIAEHKVRKGGGNPQPQTNPNAQHPAGSLAAQAAARVAARYAKAPSYSEMLADEARAAVRAAEAASKAALQAQAAAESVLAGLEAASSATQSWEPEFFTAPAPEPVWTLASQPVRAVSAPAASVAPVLAATAAPAPVKQAIPQTVSSASFEIRWDTDMPTRETGAAADSFTDPVASPWDDMPEALGPLESEGYGVVEAAQPIHANLIEFPRELVATRRLRPRRAEGGYPAPAETAGQLSIFEVEPWAISTEPQATGAAAEAGTAVYTGPEWSGIELGEEPELEIALPAASLPAAEEPTPAHSPVSLELAAINNRIMAAVVDFSLVTGTFLAAAALAASHVKVLPSVKTMEMETAAALAVIGTLYLAFFFAIAKATPGMRYANLQMRTFDGRIPTRPERFRRMAALLFSIVPVGLGMIWALFDEQHLCWHDRLSSTYLRKR